MWVAPKDTTTDLDGVGFEPLTLWLLDNQLYPPKKVEVVVVKVAKEE